MQITIGKSLSLLFLISIGALVVFGLTDPARLWLVQHAELPPWTTLPFLALYLGVALFLPTLRGTRYCAALALCLFGVYEACYVAPLGDYLCCWKYASEMQLQASEPGANALYYLLINSLGPTAALHLAPVLGLLTAFLFLNLCEQLFVSDAPAGDRTFRRRVFALLYLGAGHHWVFVQGFVENTQTSVPFLVLFLGSLHRWLAKPSTRELVRAAMWIGVACFCHAQSLFLLPALPLAVVIHRHGCGAAGRGAKEALLSIGVAALAAGTCLAVLLARGFELIVGPAFDANDLWLVPIAEDSPTTGMRWLSAAHARQAANILLTATPLVLLTPVFALRALRKQDRPPPPHWAFALPALGYVGFILLFEFDLGRPLDYDLMASMGFVVVLPILDVLFAGTEPSTLRRRTWLAVGLAVAAAGACAMAPHLTAVGARPVPVPTAAASLSLNGRVATGLGPIEVEVPGPDGVLEFELRGPPNMLAQLSFGPRDRGQRYWKHVGTMQIGTPPGLLDTMMQFQGRLDAEGRLRHRVPYTGAKAGATYGAQAIVMQPADYPAAVVIAPAIYITVKTRK